MRILWSSERNTWRGGKQRKLKMRGRKEERWFNRTGGSNGLVKAVAKRSVSMWEERRDVFKRIRRKEQMKSESMGKEAFGSFDTWEMEVNRKNCDIFRKIGLMWEMWTSEEEEKRKAMVQRWRWQATAAKPLLPQGCANPSNPDTR